MRRFKYILLSNNTGERKELVNAPVGWDNQKINIIRDLTYFGVIKTISVEFEFVGDGYNFLQQQILKYGIDADVILRVYRKNKFEAEGKINFDKYEDDRSERRFKVDIIQSSTVQKFQNREDVKLNVFNSISMERTTVTAAPTRTALIKGKSIKFYSEFNGVIYEDTPETTHHILPFKALINGNPYVQQVSNFELSTDIEENFWNVDSAHYVNGLTETQSIDITLDFTAKIHYTQKSDSNVPISAGLLIKMYGHHIWKVLKMNSDNTVAATLFTKEIDNIGGTFQFAYSGTVSFSPGQYLVAYMEKRYSYRLGSTLQGDHLLWDSTDVSTIVNQSLLSSEITYLSDVMTITQESTYADSSATVILPHELFSNLVAQILGSDNLFYSEFFGREDLGYDADGKGAYLAITKGDLLRGVPLTQTQLSTSFRDAFKSYNAIYNLGVIISGNIVKIEPKDDLLSSEIIADLGEVSKLRVGPALDFIFNSVKCGFPNNEYEQENGRDEFNTTVQYTNSVQSVKKELDLTSIYYGDGYGIEFARRAAISTTGSSDSRYDTQIFLIDLIAIGDALQSKRVEDVSYVEGIYSSDTAINLSISPGQNMLRWHKYLNIPLHRKADKVYFFQSKDKNSLLKLITTEGESFDREDLQLASAAFFIPEEKRFDSLLTLENLAGIVANPLGLVKYTHKKETFFDYLFEVNGENERGKAEWRVLSTKPSPVQRTNEPLFGNFIKWGDGPQDFLKFGDGLTDIILYED
jgi:hypothetical protein